MIFTFYGFKGGVGRTLAMVHAATILASTRGPHGNNVLVMDLDLEAPSVFLYLPPSAGAPQPHRGFVELMAEYLDSNRDAAWLREELPKIVYKAADSLYVLPSGNYTAPEYLETAHRLTEAYNSGFFRDLKIACDAEYDYVLIDSRTGMAEVAAAATILLGDVLVACFRPNQANLGIGMIVQRFLAEHSSRKDDPHAPIVPLLTPRPASHSPQAAKWAAFFQQEFFASSPLLQVPFDQVLETSDELVIRPGTLRVRVEDGHVSQSEGASNDLGAPIVAAYLALAERLAGFNTARDVISARKAELAAFLDHRYIDALRFLFQAIRRKPEDRDQWNTLMRRYVPTILDEASKDTSARELIRQFLSECLSEDHQERIESPRGRAWAHVIRAAQFGKGTEDGLADVQAALDLGGSDREIAADANFLAAQIIRFRNEQALHGARKGEESALVTRSRALREALGYLDRAVSAGRETERILRLRGEIHNDLGDYSDAVQDFDRTAALCGDPADALLDSAKTLEHVGLYGDAVRRYLTAVDAAPSNEETYRRFVPTLYRLGYFDESRQYIDRWRRINAVSPEPLRYLLGLAVTRNDRAEIEQRLAQVRDHEGTAMRIIAWALLRLQRYDEAETFVVDHIDAGAYERFQLAIAFTARGEDAVPILALPAESAAGGNFLAVASVVVGEIDLARRHLERCLAVESALPLGWRTNLLLVEALLEAAEDASKRRAMDELLSLLSTKAENAQWTRHQVEIQLLRQIWPASNGRSIPAVEDRWNEIFGVWDSIETIPFAHYKSFDIHEPQLVAV
jgi:cellulose biosynthesis protein BcsQ/tetratricopeptide (TPR) repeat protein